MPAQAVDYEAIAKKFGGTSSPAPAPDYAAIAKQFGGTSEPQPDVTVKLDYSPPSDDRTATEVMQDQAAHVLRGIAAPILHPLDTASGIIGGIARANAGGPSAQLDFLKNVVKPVTTAIRGYGSLLAPDAIAPPSRQDWEGAAEGAGTNLTLTEAANVAPPIMNAAAKGLKTVTKAVLPSAADLDAMAATNKTRALQPTTIQGKADAQTIAPELSRTGKAGGIRAAAIDKNVLAENDANSARVKAVENRLTQDPRPEMQTAKQSLIDEIDGARRKLNIPRTTVTARPEAIAQLKEIRSIVEKLPDQIDFDQLIELRRQLDDRAEEAGAFGVNADSLKADLNRGVANMVRGKLNGLDPELKIANHDYSVSRKAADMVQRRQLTETGKAPSVSGRGAVLDDLLSTWAGQALGGPVGGAVAEGLNLAVKSRGLANVKSSIQQKLADFVREPAAQPAGLLNPGPPRLSSPETSSITASPAEVAPGTQQMRTGRLLNPGIQLAPPTELPSGGHSLEVTTGAPFKRGYGDYFKIGGKDIPAVATQGPAKGMMLSHVEPAVPGTKNAIYVYTELGSGKQLRFMSPQN